MESGSPSLGRMIPKCFPPGFPQLSIAAEAEAKIIRVATVLLTEEETESQRDGVFRYSE